jgi:Ras GTPase-activating-like protein IQGAP2/3
LVANQPITFKPRSLSLSLVLALALSLDENPRFKTENDQLYSETKYLLFMVLKELPNLLVERNTSDNVRELLRLADEAARKSNNTTLLETLESIRTNCQYLTQEGILSEADDFEQLRKDAFEVGLHALLLLLLAVRWLCSHAGSCVQELLNYESLIAKTGSDLQRLQDVMRNINEHHAFLSAQLDAYKEYLANVRQNCSTGSKKSSKKESKKAVALKRKGPFKYSHAQLEKDGIIIESEVPDDRYVWSCGRVWPCVWPCASLVAHSLLTRFVIATQTISNLLCLLVQ